MPVAPKLTKRAGATALLAKRSLARALRAEMDRRDESIQSFARRLGTGRTSIRRLLDERNTSVTLATMIRAAEAVGLELALTARPLRPGQLRRLAAQLPDATPAAARKLEDQIVAGFYGGRPHA